MSEKISKDREPSNAPRGCS